MSVFGTHGLTFGYYWKFLLKLLRVEAAFQSAHRSNQRVEPSLELSIDPSGLLIPGMLAKGEVILRDGNGIEYQINITLTAESNSATDGFMETLRDPGTMFLIVGILCACWVLLGVQRKSPPEHVPIPAEVESFENFTGGGPPPSEQFIDHPLVDY